MYSSVKRKLQLPWFFCGEEEESLEGHSFVYFLDVWMKRNRSSFEDTEQSDQAIKSSFMCPF